MSHGHPITWAETIFFSVVVEGTGSGKFLVNFQSVKTSTKFCPEFTVSKLVLCLPANVTI